MTGWLIAGMILMCVLLEPVAVAIATYRLQKCAACGFARMNSWWHNIKNDNPESHKFEEASR